MFLNISRNLSVYAFLTNNGTSGFCAVLKAMTLNNGACPSLQKWL